ncbi:MAG TPA: DUF2806 domain-containing protein [Rhizobium sp.]|nr:DUF2806 domain-containing protein [Rhizobium sp.]
MSGDHLNNEISVSGELTDRGLRASAKSRTAAAFDRLVGNILDWPNTFVEADTVKRRARMEAETKIIQAATARAVELIGTDDAFAARALAGQFGDFARKQLNRDAVASIALEDLRTTPPTAEEAASGPDELTDEFMDRFQGYAEEASTEELRERWGRVLASEIRKPGTFSRKVMRAVDELSSDVAVEFESLCLSRIREGSIVREFAGEIPFDRRSKLVEAGLIVEPGLTGQVTLFGQGKYGTEDAFILPLKGWAIAIEKSYSPPSASPLVCQHNDTIGLKVYALTGVGEALSTILPDHRDKTYLRLFRALHETAADKFHCFREVNGAFEEVAFPAHPVPGAG